MSIETPSELEYALQTDTDPSTLSFPHRLRHLIYNADQAVPFIAISVLFAALAATISPDSHLVHALHGKAFHFFAAEICIWIFFSGMGNHISIQKLLQAGRVIGMATLGGVLVPVLLTFALARNWYFAMAGMATDVAFSIGGFLMLTPQGILQMLLDGLTILAVGDDVIGVVAAAIVFAAVIVFAWLMRFIGLMLVAYFAGERGVIGLGIRERGKAETYKVYEAVVRNEKWPFWVIMALLATACLSMANVHWTLAGCFIFALAPKKVKADMDQFFMWAVPLALFVFGLSAGAINLRPSAGAWGPYTVYALVGGHLGKIVGVMAFGLIGRAWEQRLRNRYDSREAFYNAHPYAFMPLAQIILLAVLTAANGTVAIWILQMAFEQGKITAEMYAQGTVGFFLTIPAMYIELLILRMLNKYQEDDSAFMPPAEPELLAT